MLILILIVSIVPVGFGWVGLGLARPDPTRSESDTLRVLFCSARQCVKGTCVKRYLVFNVTAIHEKSVRLIRNAYPALIAD